MPEENMHDFTESEICLGSREREGSRHGSVCMHVCVVGVVGVYACTAGMRLRSTLPLFAIC